MRNLKKYFFLFISVSLYFNGRGQNTAKWLYDLESPVLSFESTYFMGSPTIDNTFLKNYFEGAYIGNLIKNNTFRNLTTDNIFGAHNNFKLSYVAHADRGGTTVAYYFAAENKNIIDVQFNDKLFKLIFAGNKQFAGDSIFIKDNFLSFQGFTQLKGGIVKQIETGRFQHTFLGALALNVGTSYNNFKINNATLFTDNEGSYLDTKVDMLLQMVKNNSNSKIKFFNGLGTSADLYYNFKCDKGNNFTLALTDVGFIKWFEPHASTIQKDTAFVFEGIEIKDILNIEGSTAQLNKDSITEKFNSMKDRSSFISFLPTTLQLYFFHEFNKRIELGAGLKYMFTFAHKPYYFVDAKLYVLPQLMVSPTLSYGGYANFNGGLDLGLNFQKFNVFIGSDYMTPFFDSDNFRGKGYYFRIEYKIGYGPKSFDTPNYAKLYKNPRVPKYRANIFSNSIMNRKSSFYEKDTIYENDTIKQP